MSPKYLLVRNYPTMSSIVQSDNVRDCGIIQLCFPYVHFKGRWKLWNYPIIFSICPFWGRVKIMEFSSYFFNCPFWLCMRIVDLSNHFLYMSILRTDENNGIFQLLFQLSILIMCKNHGIIQSHLHLSILREEENNGILHLFIQLSILIMYENYGIIQSFSPSVHSEGG